MDTLVYGLDGKFEYVQRINPDGSNISFGPGSPPWADYVAQNGIPPAIGNPTFKPQRIPNDYVTMFQAVNALSGPMQTNVVQATVSWVLVNNPGIAQQINAKFGINLPFDKANT